MAQSPPRRPPPVMVIATAATTLLCGAALIWSAQPKNDATRYTFPVEGRPVLGNPARGAQVVVFFDYQCPNCKQFEERQMPAIRRDLIDQGLIHVVFLHSPFLGAASRDAAIAAECVWRQDHAAFFRFDRELWRRQGPENRWITPALLEDAARESGARLAPWRSCLRSAAAAQTVQQDLDAHEATYKRGTPEVFVAGVRTPAGGRAIQEAAADAQKAEMSRALSGH